MQIRVGSDIVFDCPQATPMLLMLNVHPSRVGDVIASDALATTPAVPVASYIDGFGNRCSRIVAPAGTLRISTRAVVRDGGEPERIVPADTEHPVETLPDECLMFLLGSRYCETDRLSDVAWSLFGRSPGGTQRVQAICDYVHNHIVFDYQRARATRTAFEAFSEMTGVCRDFAHLAIAFCRCAGRTFRPAIAPATSATSACRRRGRWISRPGSKRMLAGSGRCSIRATTRRGSAGF